MSVTVVISEVSELEATWAQMQQIGRPLLVTKQAQEYLEVIGLDIQRLAAVRAWAYAGKIWG